VWNFLDSQKPAEDSINWAKPSNMTTRAIGSLLVFLQFGLLFVFAVLCWIEAGTSLPGFFAFGLWWMGAVVGLWALRSNRPGNFNIHPEPRAGGHLIQGGPYRWIRHPMYSAVLLVAAGCAAWLSTLGGAALWCALLGVLSLKAAVEENMLLVRYPEYAAYKAHTARFLPGVY
jgi:protein-S-isoprenylcysteine O-methyltransferase Ste14